MLKVEVILSSSAEEAKASPPARVRGTLTLPFELRQKSRLVASLDDGVEVVLSLPRGGVLRNGALLQASDGSAIEVRSAPETLSYVESPSPTLLARAAYHLGNRHVPLQIDGGRLSYEHDHVLDEMLHGLGLHPHVVQAPFEPEAGAYAHGAGHHHHDGPSPHPHDHEH
jgi:urease accessory protein